MIVQHTTVNTDPSNPGPRVHLVRPDNDGIHPGLLLIQEWWGIEPHVLDMAERLAREGFTVAVPDLYHGKVANEPNDAMKLVMVARDNLERVLREVSLAADLLAASPFVKANAAGQKTFGIMGFCMGGMVAFRAACRDPRIVAANPWYGGGIDPSAEDLSKLKAPLLMIYGETDGGIPVDQVRTIEARLRAAGKSVDVHIYPGAGHAFNNPTHGAYHGPSAEDAWARALAFLKANVP